MRRLEGQLDEWGVRHRRVEVQEKGATRLISRVRVRAGAAFQIG